MDQDPTPRRPQYPYEYATTHDPEAGSSTQAQSQSERTRSWHAQGAAGDGGAHRRPHVHFTIGGGDSTEDPVQLSSDARNDSRTSIQSSAERKKGKMREDSAKFAQGEDYASQAPVSRPSSFDGEDPDTFQPDSSDDEHHDKTVSDDGKRGCKADGPRRGSHPRDGGGSGRDALDSVMILLRKPCYYFYFLEMTKLDRLTDLGPYIKVFSQTSAFERAQTLAHNMGHRSEPPLRYPTSPVSTAPNSPPRPLKRLPETVDEIPLLRYPASPVSTAPSSPPRRLKRLPRTIDRIPLVPFGRRSNRDQGHNRGHTNVDRSRQRDGHDKSKLERLRQILSLTIGASEEDIGPPKLRSGRVTPISEGDPDDYVPPPDKYRRGVLSMLLRYNGIGPLNKNYSYASQGTYSDQSRHGSGTQTPVAGPDPQVDRPRRASRPQTPRMGSNTRPGSGQVTPRSTHPKWYNKNPSPSGTSLAGLVGCSSVLALPAAGSVADTSEPKVRPPVRKVTPPIGKGAAAAATIFGGPKPGVDDEIRILVHIATTLARQRYLSKLCRALMAFGAPTHRLEEYIRMTARVLEVEGQFLYIPGCMIISFDDASTHTAEVKLVRSEAGVDLSKLRDTHQVYKEVVHDVIGVEDATQRLEAIIRREPKYSRWTLVFVYGLASATVGPFAFEGRFIDMPVAFFLGCLLGFLQLILAPKSELYSNVFEISAAVLTSFLARAFASIGGGKVFCFSALAQSAIALILPGYTVLCGSLELQSRSLVAGSVRMVYAIIYSLLLGFGITIGTAIYGLMDVHAVTPTSCSTKMPKHYHFMFVPLFTLCLIVINQGRWKQAPIMTVIAFAGYVVNYFSSIRFPSNAQISNTLGALCIGFLANVYSRVQHDVAAAIMLPAIFVQVPSGLAASGSLVSGVRSANEILNITNGGAAGGKTTLSSGTDSSSVNSVVFNVGYSVIQVAIGITVGLFLSALLVYPFGKRRSGLFSF